MINLQILRSRIRRTFKGWVKVLVVFLVIGAVLILLSSLARTPSNTYKSTEPQLSNDGTSKATVEIGKIFKFQAVNAKKEDVSVKFTIISAERKNEIKLKGEPRRPAAGNDYLLLRIEIQNDKTERVAISPADRIRLEIDGKLFAPDYHNGNVVIDPISVKKDLVAFAVESKQKEFVLKVGELDGEKERVEIKF